MRFLVLPNVDEVLKLKYKNFNILILQDHKISLKQKLIIFV